MEVNKRHCKKCGQLKDRIEAGKFPNGRDKKWRDESGKLWSGKICGLCNNTRTKEIMKKARDDRKANGNSETSQ